MMDEWMDEIFQFIDNLDTPQLRHMAIHWVLTGNPNVLSLTSP